MRVFITGATGFIGSAIVAELIDAGHEVVGLARSDDSAAALIAAGAEPHRGDLEDLASLRAGAAAADGVIHCAFNHDFANVSRESAAEADQRAVRALGEALEGTGRPLVITSGTALLRPGRLATERDAVAAGVPAAGRAVSETIALSMASRDVRPAVVRLPPSVHGAGDYGFVPALIEIARSRGVSAYIGDGANRWPAVHRLDAAHLFCLAVESAPAGAVLHGVGEEGVPTRAIAEVIGRHLDVEVVSIDAGAVDDHFSWLGAFFALDVPASSTLTREQLGWEPSRPGLIADLEQGHYFATATV
jgi:nucleoside-diphosphate-sugar epimerase